LNSKLIHFPSIKDERGILDVASTPTEVPFQIKRFFVTSASSPMVVRGDHAHKTSHQLLVAVSGSIKATCDDGRTRIHFLLNSSSFGLYLPPLTWGSQTEFSEGAKLLVLASELYDPEDYIANYSEFISLVLSQES
jgi:dTDP-4-dehydrorhamnose 3,5-epimerase-like enzyme